MMSRLFDLLLIRGATNTTSIKRVIQLWSFTLSQSQCLCFQRMVHLVAPQDAERYGGPQDATDPETELLNGPGAGDVSQEASGFYGTDMEDRERGEEAGEDRERRGGEEEWEREEDRERRGGDVRAEEEEEEEERKAKRDDQDALEANHTTPDLDALIGQYQLSPHRSICRCLCCSA